MLANLLFWSSACYVGLAHGGALLLNLAAWSGLHRAEQGNMLAELPHVHTDLEPPISVILQAHDDASRVVPALRALLTLHYPALEIIVVNDGSRDNTMEVLRTAFELLPFPEAYRVQLATRPVTQIYRSMRHANLRVLDKQAAGCADAWNAGINAARYPLVCCIDCDTNLQADGLHRLALPFLTSADAIAVAGVLNGVAGSERSPSRPGFLASLRTQLFGPLGWAALNALLIAPAGVQLMRKDAAIHAGGYDRDAAGPQAGMLMRLHEAACARRMPYQIAFVGDAIGSRRSDIATKREQCRVWQQTLLDSLYRQRALPLRRNTCWSLRLAFLFLLIFEALGPLFELLSYTWVIIAAAVGLLPSPALVAFLSFAVGSGVLLSVSGLLLDALSFDNARKIAGPGRLVLVAVVENLGYRQLHAWWRTLALTSWLRSVRPNEAT